MGCSDMVFRPPPAVFGSRDEPAALGGRGSGPIANRTPVKDRPKPSSVMQSGPTNRKTIRVPAVSIALPTIRVTFLYDVFLPRRSAHYEGTFAAAQQTLQEFLHPEVWLAPTIPRSHSLLHQATILRREES
jgi:hypothetical protein